MVGEEWTQVAMVKDESFMGLLKRGWWSNGDRRKLVDIEKMGARKWEE